MATAYIGEIRPFGFNFAPVDWMLCQGQLLPITQYTAVFSILGTTYGGNGTSTFGLPDLRGRAPIHYGANGINAIGQLAGTENVTLLVSNLPSHTHFLSVSSADATAQSPAGAVFAAPDARLGPPIYEAGPAAATMATGMLASQGSNAAFSIMQPSLTINFCICVVGVFPSRN